MSVKAFYPPARSLLSRRRFLQSAAVVVPGFAALSGCGGDSNGLIVSPGLVKPLPGGLQVLGPGTETFHFFLPNSKAIDEPSSITDFNGTVGLAAVDGTGIGRGPGAGPSTPLLFDVDVRFMQGEYVAANGRHSQGAFAFV